MFVLGIIFATLAGLQVFFLITKAVSSYAARRLLSFSENHPTLKYDMEEKNQELRAKLDQIEKVSSSGPRVAALIFLTLAILCFYFQ